MDFAIFGDDQKANSGSAVPELQAYTTPDDKLDLLGHKRLNRDSELIGSDPILG